MTNDRTYSWRLPDQGANARNKECFVTFRPDCIQLNSHFMEQAGGKQTITHVFLMVDDDTFSLRLEMLTQHAYESRFQGRTYQSGIYKLAPDGGNAAGSKSRVLVCRRLYTQTPWLKEIADQDVFAKRRFVPFAGEGRNVFIVECMPSFMNKEPLDEVALDASLKGIYRYTDENGAILYIGQGNLKARLKSHEVRKQMPAAFFEWTVIEDEQLRFCAEAHHLQIHRKNFGSLPPFNKIAGRGES